MIILILSLLPLSVNKNKINDIIEDAECERQINPVIVDTIEIMQLEKEDKVFYNEINKGIILWEE